MTNSNSLKPTFASKTVVLIILFFIGLCIASVFSAIIVQARGLSALVALIATLAQDILAFIAPAMLCAAVFRQHPGKALCLNRKPPLIGVLAVVLVYFLSLPAMNYLIDCNQNMSLPQSLSAVEQWMRQYEELAAKQTQLILAQKSLAAVLFTFFVVAVMAGVSEEIFFRGAWQQFIFSSKTNSHAAVWITAFIFSFIHFQFFGFVPRLLLGAWLGYLLVWSRSLWLPITAHVLNNGMVVAASHLSNLGLLSDKAIDNFGLPSNGSFPWLALASAAVTAAAIWLLHRSLSRRAARV